MKKTDPATALEQILHQVKPLRTKRIDLADALGRTLARDVRADRDSPPTNRSAMDGYAVRAADLSEPNGRLRLIGEVAAGADQFPSVTTGTCTRIFTGAVVPPGADTVVKVEQTCEQGDSVVFFKKACQGAHIRVRGEEYCKGTNLLTPGTILGPVQIGLCASVGKAAVWVYRQPRVAILSTGTELVDVGDTVRPWQLRNSNGPMLRAAVQQAGGLCVAQRDVPDNEEELVQQLRGVTAEADMVILSGGVSVGRYDLVPQAIKRLPASIHFHGVTIKPGKPVLFATHSRKLAIFGLPGNPVSAINGFFEFVLPALRRLSGNPIHQCQQTWHLPLHQDLQKKCKRTLCALVQVDRSGSAPTVTELPSQGSAHLAAAALAHGVAVLPPETDTYPAGTSVAYRPWRMTW